MLPALRRELALAWKGEGVSQKEIARLLGVTEPAVSQYISSKRASGIKFNDKILSAVKLSASKIKDEMGMVREVQKLISLAKQERVLCQVHASLGNVPRDCNLCFE